MIKQTKFYQSRLGVDMVSVMAYMLQIGESTIHRIFVAWIAFIEVIFSYFTFRPDDGFLPNIIPEVFIKVKHDITDIIIA